MSDAADIDDVGDDLTPVELAKRLGELGSEHLKQALARRSQPELDERELARRKAAFLGIA